VGMGQYMLFIDFQKGCDSVRGEVLYNILIKLGIPMKLVGLIKMCFNKTCSEVHIGRNLSIAFPVQNGLKQDASSSLFIFALEYGSEWNTSVPDLH